MFEKLFRGKRVDNDEWVFGDLIQLYDGRKFIINNKHGACIDDKGKFINTEAPFVCEVFDDSVGQYTGLTDKHGTKIFEGDIIKQTFSLKQSNGKSEREVISVVKYGISSVYSYVCGVCQRFSDGSGIAMLSVMDTSGIVDCEVIGNIHDNPELLKEGADNGKV